MCRLIIYPSTQAEVLNYVQGIGRQEPSHTMMIFAYGRIQPNWSCPSVPQQSDESTGIINARIDYLIKSGQAVVRTINLKQGQKGRRQRRFSARVIYEKEHGSLLTEV